MGEDKGRDPSVWSWTDFWTGASIGALVGFLLGLSVSETVGAAIAALVAMLGAFFGVGQPAAGPVRAGRAGRIAGFGVACAAAVAAGVWVRAHDALSPGVDDLMADWRAIGVPEERARELVVYQRLGLVPEGATQGDRPRGDGSVLFSGEDGDACLRLDDPVYADAEALRSAMRAEGGAWPELAERPGDLAALRARVEAICR
ncbi:MAG: hypothetical protein AAF322_16420 [Pseudomonadota bacterium]